PALLVVADGLPGCVHGVGEAAPVFGVQFAGAACVRVHRGAWRCADGRVPPPPELPQTLARVHLLRGDVATEVEDGEGRAALYAKHVSGNARRETGALGNGLGRDHGLPCSADLAGGGADCVHLTLAACAAAAAWFSHWRLSRGR